MEFTSCIVDVDGKTIPAGTSIDQLPAGSVASLRRVGKIVSASSADAKADAKADASNAKKPAGKKPAGKKPAKAEVIDTVYEGDPDDALAIGDCGLPTATAELFVEAKIATLGDARKYFAEHGSFEPIHNVGKVKSEEAVQLLGLVSAETDSAE